MALTNEILQNYFFVRGHIAYKEYFKKELKRKKKNADFFYKIYFMCIEGIEGNFVFSNKQTYFLQDPLTLVVGAVLCGDLVFLTSVKSSNGSTGNTKGKK